MNQNLQTHLNQLSQLNGTRRNTHVHPRSHSERSSVAEKLSHTLSEKKSYFHSGSLGNVWGFPCFYGDEKQEFWSLRETEINTTVSPSVEIIGSTS